MDFDYIKNYITNFELVKNNFIEVLKESFKFSGTLNRTKYWTYSILTGILTGVLSCVLGIIPLLGWILAGVISLVVMVINIAPQARRLRDAGFSPWCMLLHLTGIGILIVFILCCLKSKVNAESSSEEVAPASETPAEENKAE